MNGVFDVFPPSDEELRARVPHYIPPAEPKKVIGMKEDTGKARLSLLWREPLGPALAAVAGILQYGIEKYKVQAGNWAHVENAKERYADALYRHMAAHVGGEVRDPESGKLHLAHVACNALFLVALEIKEPTK